MRDRSLFKPLGLAVLAAACVGMLFMGKPELASVAAQSQPPHAQVSTASVNVAELDLASIQPKTQASAGFVAPKLSLDGTGKYEQGEFVSLGIKMDGQPQNHVRTSYDWRVFEYTNDLNGQVSQNERRIQSNEGQASFFAVVANKLYQVEVTCTSIYVVRQKDETGKIRVTDIGTSTQVLRGSITVGSPVPGPNPGPSPTPTPTPNLSDGRFKLAKVAFDAASVANDPARAASAKALGASWRSVAVRIKSGELTDFKSVFKATETSNQGAVTNRAAWEPVMSKIGDAVYALYSAQTIKTPTDLSDAWGEIASGFEAVQR